MPACLECCSPHHAAPTCEIAADAEQRANQKGLHRCDCCGSFYHKQSASAAKDSVADGAKERDDGVKVKVKVFLAGTPYKGMITSGPYHGPIALPSSKFTICSDCSLRCGGRMFFQEEGVRRAASLNARHFLHRPVSHR
jgi:hypothetical protein